MAKLGGFFFLNHYHSPLSPSTSLVISFSDEGADFSVNCASRLSDRIPCAIIIPALKDSLPGTIRRHFSKRRESVARQSEIVHNLWITFYFFFSRPRIKIRLGLGPAAAGIVSPGFSGKDGERETTCPKAD
ncbi:hypothetical protein VTO42DRAFT_2280 [Malbranchea cinnamomea]